MKILVIGDLHSNLKPLKSLIKEQPDADAILSVGDLGFYFSEEACISDKKQYARSPNLMKSFFTAHELGLLEPFPIPIYFIKGNHDDYDNLDSQAMKDLNVHFIPQGHHVAIGNMTVSGMGGIYSSVRTKLPTDQLTGRERRFYTTEEFKNFRAIDPAWVGAPADILITHQAPAGCLPNKTKGYDEGSPQIQALLDRVQPRFHFHGHHHTNYQKKYDENTTVVGLGNFGKNDKSYRIIESIEGKVYMYDT